MPETIGQLEIVYQDEHLVAINKPPGLLVHRSPIDKHETRFALQMLRDQLGQHVFSIHRLDKPTSGLLLFALNPETQKQLGIAFGEGKVSKRYQAITRGYTLDEETIDYSLPIMSDFKDQPASEARQSAITQYRTLERIEIPVPCGRYDQSRYSLIELSPETGRKHQLRRHMKHVFHPIIGDTTHGDGKHNKLFRQHFNSHRLMLAATKLSLTHPVTGDILALACGVGSEFLEMKRRLWPENSKLF